jgi:hypothetical protein
MGFAARHDRMSADSPVCRIQLEDQPMLADPDLPF